MLNFALKHNNEQHNIDEKATTLCISTQSHPGADVDVGKCHPCQGDEFVREPNVIHNGPQLCSVYAVVCCLEDDK